MSDTSDIKLKPCPFCGSQNVRLSVIEDTPHSYVTCNSCRISVEIKNDMKIHKDKLNTLKRVVAKIWNTRNYKEDDSHEVIS